MDARDILMIYGSDISSMTRQLVDRIQIEQLVHTDDRIVLKPNLVVPSDPSEGATTHREIVETLVQYLHERQYRNIAIVESSWIGSRTEEAFRAHRYHEIAQRYNVDLVDVKRDSYQSVTSQGYVIEMSRTIIQADFLINLPVLKGHCQTNITCALKNMKGCISDASKRKFHAWGLHEPIAALNAVRSADLVIVDSINGDLDFEEGGNPVKTNRMFAGRDSVLIDAFGAQLMGFDVSDIPYIALAEGMQVGSTELESAHIEQLNTDSAVEMPRPSGRVAALRTHTVASSACSACYGNLIFALARLEKKGLLGDLRRSIHIGQDFKGRTVCGIGVGSCTSGFTQSLAGCPPKALDMVRFLERYGIDA